MFIHKESIMGAYPVRTGNPKNMGLYVIVNNNFVLTTDTTFQNNVTYYLSFGKYIVEAKYGYHKLWGEDTGRNLAGDYTGTLLGVFPKITMQFKKLTKSELELVAPILDNATQTLYYYDPNKKTMKSMQTYTGDYEVVNKYFISNKDSEKNEGFSCAFISTKKRS